MSASIPVTNDSEPLRVHQSTDDARTLSKIKKRIVVCCDGTWQDGLSAKHRSMYTNILRLARTIEHEDTRHNPPIPQVCLYQSGIGSEGGFYAEFVEGTTGATLGSKVEEAYGFITQNYAPGDEVRLNIIPSEVIETSMRCPRFISLVSPGELMSRMDHFSSIFVAYQTLGKSQDDEEIQKMQAILAPFRHESAPGILRAYAHDRTFSVKSIPVHSPCCIKSDGNYRCVGVFETVGSVGLPEELTLKPQVKKIFGFPDKILGEHIERAYHALALNETREDFECAKFEQTEVGKSKGQVLEQCWFTGCHSDVGGGYRYHDLADLTLAWMVSNVSDILAVDTKYLATLPSPVAPWGKQDPHDPATGIFSLASQVKRAIPTSYNEVTKETFHPSVLQQTNIDPEVSKIIEEHPEMLADLKPLEKELQSSWTIDEASVYTMNMESSSEEKKDSSSFSKAFKALKDLTTTSADEV
ncbi:hypothetical protein D9758_000331 [Tetrapyrgos nigripes]|uniref:T6SS Phospholipase effector Tle1-like catalytic domain-containing protein n=1 Tax=Tetrapyrgos nigripes TaxID=182062 RepID=A0A8H5H1C7_9AGAR|nr:hypothetical protein D9758_000331 [Tetrapyrgos nigripes]